MKSEYDSSLLSLYKIAVSSSKQFPQVIKTLLEQSKQHDDTIHKTCFLYFYELMGIKGSDRESLDTLFQFQKSAKKELTKAQLDKIKFNAYSFALNAPGPKI